MKASIFFFLPTCCLPGSFTSRLLQDSLKERLWTRYQQITDRGTGPWPLGDPTGGALFPLTGLGSSTTEGTHRRMWKRERERETDREGGTETQRLSRWNTGMRWQGWNTRADGSVPRAPLWRGHRYSYGGRAELDQGIHSVGVRWQRLAHLRTALSLSLHLQTVGHFWGQRRRKRTEAHRKSHSLGWG